MNSQSLFAGRSDRLVARLKCMLYAWRFIEQAGGRAFIIWPKLPPRYTEENVDYSPFQIFDLVNYYAGGGSDRLQFLDCQGPLPKSGRRLDSPELSEFVKSGFDRGSFSKLGDTLCQAGSPQYRFSDEPNNEEYMISNIRRLFDELPVHPHILRGKDNFLQRLGLEPKGFDAIHVRRGDVYDMIRSELPGLEDGTLKPDRLDLIVNHFIVRTAPIEFYEPAVLNAISQDRKIIFTSDSPEVIQDFRKAFGRDRFIDLSSARMAVPIQKAFLDFLILRDARHIIGTSSNFSQLPAELGGIENENVAGTGDLDIAARTFHDAFLSTSSLDQNKKADVMKRMLEHYAVFQNRRQASIRARSAARKSPATVGAPTEHPI